ncbi:MAG: hypothetical protein IPM26_17225 [Saprospiraceae bacterium]|nr:hypothetical protein [Saprospiraceae bacterium]
MACRGCTRDLNLLYSLKNKSNANDLLINGSSPGDVQVNPHMLQISLRLGFRPDYNKRSYRR